MYDGIGKSISNGICFMSICLGVFVPLGLWKIIDIIIWFFSHIKWCS